MFEERKFTIEGVAPLLVHNGRLCNPIDPIVREMKQFSGKRNKTESDYESLAKLEFMGSLYLGEHNEPVIPGECIEAMIINAAKKSKKGPSAKAGLICDGNWPIIYDGPKDPEAMWNDGGFADARRVVVQRAAVIRTRPVFRNWKLTFNMHYNPSLVNKSELEDWVSVAGHVIGLGDYRPRFGRFVVGD